MYITEYIRILFAFSLIAVTTPSGMLNTGTSGIISSASAAVKRVEAIVGGEADLSCDTQPPTRNDSLMLVVWYRDDNPVYSYDTRLPATSAHWVDELYIGRTLWHNVPSTGLHIRSIQARDRAIYRCRVDFYVSPTRNYKVALDVVEPPSKPVIFDDIGRKISGIAGPYYEGSEFKLICVVTGGYPTPRIQWLQDDTVLRIMSAGEVTSPARSITLIVNNATRTHLSTIYTCATDNTLLVPAQKTSVKVDIYLKPLSIEITSKEQPLSVGTKAEFSCKTTGSRPPAIITWWLDNQKMTGNWSKPGLREANETESLLQWIPSKEHNGKVLACRAENPNFNHSYIERKLTLDVYYMPEAAIHLGAEINPNDIEEGDDVYFRCKVYANPPAYKVVWEHNGVLIQHQPKHGIMVVENTNLVIQKVSRHNAGKYTCTASNVEGDGKSPELEMQVIYRPLCQKKHLKIIGGILQEPTKVVCEVDAFPPPNTFEWTLNSSAGTTKIDSKSYTVNPKDGKSILTYTPTSEADYGTLLCRATNLAGPQLAPCIYSLLPARRPEPLSNCSINNLTDNSLDLQCLSGYNGGLQCVYIVEVWSNERLVINASSDNAIWNLRRLGANRQLQLIVYAANLRGRSEHVTMMVETLKILPKTEPQQLWEMGWTTGVLLGAALTLTTVTLSVAVITRTKFRSRDYEVTFATLKNQKLIKRNSSRGTEDKNPDVIPFNKETPPDPLSYATIAAFKDSKSTHSLNNTQTLLAPMHINLLDNQTDHSLINEALISQREIVTTRTPLLAEHQESCV